MDPNRVPIIGDRQAAVQAAVLQAAQSLSLSIYQHLAVAYLVAREADYQAVDVDRLRQAARDSQAAAKAYFEGIGIVAKTPEPQGDNHG